MKVTLPVDVNVFEGCGNMVKHVGHLRKGTEVSIQPPLLDCECDDNNIQEIATLKLGTKQYYVFVEAVRIAGLRDKLKRLERLTVIEGGVVTKHAIVTGSGMGVENIY